MSTLPVHATASSEPAFYEPDEQWRFELNDRTEESFKTMLEEVKESLGGNLRQAGISDVDRDHYKVEYTQSMNTTRRRATEAYRAGLDRERQERRRETGKPTSTGWSEALVHEQKEIIRTFEDAIGQYDVVSASLAEGPIKERQLTTFKVAAERAATAAPPPTQQSPTRERTYDHSLPPLRRQDDTSPATRVLHSRRSMDMRPIPETRVSHIEHPSRSGSLSRRNSVRSLTKAMPAIRKPAMTSEDIIAGSGKSVATARRDSTASIRSNGSSSRRPSFESASPFSPSSSHLASPSLRRIASKSSLSNEIRRHSPERGITLRTPAVDVADYEPLSRSSLLTAPPHRGHEPNRTLGSQAHSRLHSEASHEERTSLHGMHDYEPPGRRLYSKPSVTFSESNVLGSQALTSLAPGATLEARTYQSGAHEPPNRRLSLKPSLTFSEDYVGYNVRQSGRYSALQHDNPYSSRRPAERYTKPSLTSRGSYGDFDSDDDYGEDMPYGGSIPYEYRQVLEGMLGYLRPTSARPNPSRQLADRIEEERHRGNNDGPSRRLYSAPASNHVYVARLHPPIRTLSSHNDVDPPASRVSVGNKPQLRMNSDTEYYDSDKDGEEVEYLEEETLQIAKKKVEEWRKEMEVRKKEMEAREKGMQMQMNEMEVHSKRIETGLRDEGLADAISNTGKPTRMTGGTHAPTSQVLPPHPSTSRDRPYQSGIRESNRRLSSKPSLTLSEDNVGFDIHRGERYSASQHAGLRPSSRLPERYSNLSSASRRSHGELGTGDNDAEEMTYDDCSPYEPHPTYEARSDRSITSRPGEIFDELKRTVGNDYWHMPMTAPPVMRSSARGGASPPYVDVGRTSVLAISPRPPLNRRISFSQDQRANKANAELPTSVMKSGHLPISNLRRRSSTFSSFSSSPTSSPSMANSYRKPTRTHENYAPAISPYVAPRMKPQLSSKLSVPPSAVSLYHNQTMASEDMIAASEPSKPRQRPRSASASMLINGKSMGWKDGETRHTEKGRKEGLEIWEKDDKRREHGETRRSELKVRTVKEGRGVEEERRRNDEDTRQSKELKYQEAGLARREATAENCTKRREPGEAKRYAEELKTMRELPGEMEKERLQKEEETERSQHYEKELERDKFATAYAQYQQAQERQERRQQRDEIQKEEQLREEGAHQQECPLEPGQEKPRRREAEAMAWNMFEGKHSDFIDPSMAGFSDGDYEDTSDDEACMAKNSGWDMDPLDDEERQEHQWDGIPSETNGGRSNEQDSIFGAYNMLKMVCSNRSKYKRLLNLESYKAQLVLDIMQTVLDHAIMNSAESKFENILLKAMLRLSKRSTLCPRSYALSDIERGEYPIASGHFGEIFQGDYNGRKVSLKVFKLYSNQMSKINDLVKAFYKEAILWRHLIHVNLLPFYGIYRLGDSGGRICLVSPWMKNGNIIQYLQQHPNVNRQHLVLDIAQGMSYLHSKSFIHGDLKGVNVLISDNGIACLTDFGLSSIINTHSLGWNSMESTVSNAGTIRWQAPELIDTEDKPSAGVTIETDIYAFACVCYEVLAGKIPFYQFTVDATVIFKVMSGQRPLRPELNPERGLTEWMWSLIEECWDQDPIKRPVASEVVAKLHSKDGFIRDNIHETGWGELRPEVFRSLLDQHSPMSDADIQRCMSLLSVL